MRTTNNRWSNLPPYSEADLISAFADHDHLFKELITVFFIDFVELFLPAISEEFEEEGITFLSSEVFTDITGGEKHIVDILARARYRGTDAFFLVHIENQATSQPDFHQRMFFYFAELHRKYRLPVLPVAIFSFEKPLRAEPNEYRVTFPGFIPLEFKFHAIQLNRLNWRDYLNRQNPVAAALMSRMKIDIKDRPRVKLECLRLLATLKLDPARSQLIKGFIDSYLNLSAAEMTVFKREIESIPNDEKEANDMSLLTIWKEEGLAEGRAEGHIMGRAEGAQAEAVQLVIRLLRKRFEYVSADFENRINALALEYVETLAEEILDFSSLEEAETWVNAHLPDEKS